MSDIKILIVEDERIYAEDMKLSLLKMGYSVVGIVSSGEKAIELAEETKPDLILMDIVLVGERDGIETASVIRARQNIPVVYLTGHMDDKTLFKAKLTEPFGYIVKPHGDRELRSAIEMAIYKHEVEVKLKDSESLFRRLVENSPAIIFRIELKPKLKVSYISPTVSLVTGYCPLEYYVDADLFFRQIYGEDRDLILPLDKQDIKIKDPQVLRWVRKDRQIIWMEQYNVLIYNKDKELVAVEGLCIDISKRKKIEGALKTTEANLHTIIDSNADAIIIIDKGGAIRFVNPAAENLFKFDKDSLIGINFDYPVVIGEISEIEIGTKGTDKKVAEIRTVDIEWDGKKAYLATLRDISWRKRAEAERENLQATLLQAQKMEALGRLAGGIAHDFNNILTAILGYTDILLPHIEYDNSMKDNLNEINKLVDRAATLIRQLMTFSREQAIKLGPVNLNTLVKSMMDMLIRLLGEEIELTTELDPHLKLVNADYGRIEIVLMNLVLNARDAMRSSGKIVVKTENVTIDQDGCTNIPFAKQGDFVEISVHDSGYGIDNERIQHIFEPFFTTKGEEEGTGLGLSIVYGIIEQHQGWIDVISEVERGSIFTVYLPVANQDLEIVKEKPVSDKTIYKGEGRILIVEDEESVLRIASVTLQKAGYVVFKASDYDEAVEIFDDKNSEIDIVICDIVLPRHSGIELADYMISKKSDLGIIMSSGYPFSKSKMKDMGGKNYGFLQKPYTVNRLIEKIKEVSEDNLN